MVAGGRGAMLIRSSTGHSVGRSPINDHVHLDTGQVFSIYNIIGCFRDRARGGGFIQGPASVPLCSHPRYTSWGGGGELCQY